MCGSGVTACQLLLALEVAGLDGAQALCGLLERVDPRSSSAHRHGAEALGTARFGQIVASALGLTAWAC